MISAIYGLALTTGANRVIRGARIEHVEACPAPGTRIFLEIPTVCCDSTIRILAEVVRETEAGGFAVKFVHLPPPLEEELKEFMRDIAFPKKPFRR